MDLSIFEAFENAFCGFENLLYSGEVTIRHKELKIITGLDIKFIAKLYR